MLRNVGDERLQHTRPRRLRNNLKPKWDRELRLTTTRVSCVVVQPDAVELVGGGVTSVTVVKCTLNSQAYGTFIANMILPWCVPIIALFFLIPFVAWSRMRMWKRNRAPIPVFRGRFGIPRVCARCRCLRVPMDDRVRY